MPSDRKYGLYQINIWAKCLDRKEPHSFRLLMLQQVDWASTHKLHPGVESTESLAKSLVISLDQSVLCGEHYITLDVHPLVPGIWHKGKK